MLSLPSLLSHFAVVGQLRSAQCSLNTFNSSRSLFKDSSPMFLFVDLSVRLPCAFTVGGQLAGLVGVGVQDTLQREHNVTPGSGSAELETIDENGADDGTDGATVNLAGLHGDYDKMAKNLSGKVNRISELKSFLESNPPPAISLGDLTNSLQMHSSYSMMLSFLRRSSKDGSQSGPPPSFSSAQIDPIGPHGCL